MSYVDGFVIAVPTVNKQALIDHAGLFDPIFLEYGATRVLECWGDDVPHGKQTDMYRATKAKEAEVILFSWTAWPDRATCDAAAQKMMAEMDGQEMPEMPFDGMRMIWGGFETVFDSAKA